MKTVKEILADNIALRTAVTQIADDHEIEIGPGVNCGAVLSGMIAYSAGEKMAAEAARRELRKVEKAGTRKEK